MAPIETDIELYTAGTPNGQKISCCLEELGLKYKVHHIDISKNEQKEEWFLKINPNGRIPALTDRTNRAHSPKHIFEGGAILLYLTAHYDPTHTISLPYNSNAYWETVEWITWLQSGIGPMQGQANHFYRYAPTKIEYAINRYQTETRRLYAVLEARLVEQEGLSKGSEGGEDGGDGAGGPWIVGGKYTIADLACFSWINWAEWAGVETKGFEQLQKWLERIQGREAIRRGVDVPEPFEMKEKMKTKEGEEEYAKYHSNWVMQGQEKDQEKHK